MLKPLLVFLHGPVASGKLTVARELAATTDLPLFHNHLTVDLLLTLFPFGDPSFVRLRESIWLETISAAIARGTSLIFTFAPEKTVAPDFPEKLRRRVDAAGGRIAFVGLRCAETEIEHRLAAPSRREHRKLTSPADYHALRNAGAFDYPPIESDLIVDTAKVAPPEAARIIADALELVDADPA